MKFSSPKIAIQIPEPCQENWQEMSQAEKGRFCSACQKTVVDFSQMTDNEIVKYFKNHAEQKTCGHFKTTQVNRPIRVPNRLEEWYWQVEMKYKESFLKRTYLFLLSGALLLTGCENPERDLAYNQEVVENQITSLKKDIELEKRKQALKELKAKQALELEKVNVELRQVEEEAKQALEEARVELASKLKSDEIAAFVYEFQAKDLLPHTTINGIENLPPAISGFVSTKELQDTTLYPLSFLNKKANCSKPKIKNKSNSVWTWVMDKLR